MINCYSGLGSSPASLELVQMSHRRETAQAASLFSFLPYDLFFPFFFL